MEPTRSRSIRRRIAAAALQISCAAVLLASQHALAAVGTVTLSDPVPTLLDGPVVTANADRLAAGGRAVEGVAADGTSEIVVAVGAASAGQAFTFTVYNDQGAPSASTAEDGALAAAGSTDFDHSQLATAAVTTSGGAMAFVVYRAPLDFARPGGGDDALAERSVSIHWSASGASGAIPISVLRPPVVLIHGLWSKPATWDGFTPLVGDSRFAIFRVNYATLEQPINISTAKPLTPSPVSAHALGFAFDARYVAPQIESFVEDFKDGQNPLNVPVSDVQADVVAHSMGGDITRTLPIMAGFASATTFGHGDIHKAITIDTPHLGTPIAADLLEDANGNDPNECVRVVFDAAIGYSMTSAETPAGVPLDGAMGDLEGNGSGGALSPALQAMLSSSTTPPLQTQLLPIAFVAGVAGPTQLGGLDYCHAHQDGTIPEQCLNYALLQDICSDDPLVQNMTSADWTDNVMLGTSDSLVPFTSEDNNSSYAPVSVTAIHTASLEKLGLNGPGVLQPAAGTAEHVIALLNTWIADSPPFAHLR